MQDNNNKQAQASRKKSSGPAKKKKFFGVGIDSDEDEENEPCTDPVDNELESYKCEKKAKTDMDPLIWWSSRLQLYPRLAKLATKYLAVLASSTPSERAMSKMDLILNKKRMKLTSSHFGMLMFLSDTV